TPTHLLLSGSPALDAGTASGAPAADQRGVARRVDAPATGSFIDLGAVEMGGMFLVTTTADEGPGSLRQALLNANAFAGTELIRFAIGEQGSQTITLESPLPTITEPVLLDGWTQGGTSYEGPPLIALDGSLAGGTGLHVTAGGTLIRGLDL